MKGAHIYTDIQENKLTGERHIFYRRLYYSPSLFSECKIQSFHFYLLTTMQKGNSPAAWPAVQSGPRGMARR